MCAARVRESSSQKPFSHTKSIALFLGVPVAVFVVALLLVSLPGWLANPKYDFIYVTCDWGCDGGIPYAVNENGQVIQTDINDNGRNMYEVHYYDAARNSSRTISIFEARKYRLDPFGSSPDGYTLKYDDGYVSRGLVFGSSYRNDSWRLAKGWLKKEVSIGEQYSGSSVRVLGWVKK